MGDFGFCPIRHDAQSTNDLFRDGSSRKINQAQTQAGGTEEVAARDRRSVPGAAALAWEKPMLGRLLCKCS